MTSLDPHAAADLDKALDRIHKQYGPSAIWRLGDQARQQVPAISSGCPGLDHATGCGGYPRGRIIEIYGPESSGKTTLALHAIASCQAAGGIAAFIDAEHALDPTYARNLGVALDDLLVSQPDHGEQALDICEHLVESGAVDLIIVDSVAALVPRAELEGDVGDQHVGLQARMMSQAMRKLTGPAKRHEVCVIFINQLRQKIGVTFGSGEVTTGGNALKFYASLRLDVRRIGQVKQGDVRIGSRTRVRAVKNKLAPPFRQAEFDIMWGTGICEAGNLLDLALDSGIVSRSGSWYSLGDRTLGQGREATRQLLLGDAELMARLRALVEGALGLTPESDPAEA
ncbi:MAG: recombinase RecA [Deltaproteobacteria bacterium]|nr:MAG: recombinase RecA [Deltaproteobacteria bacterium]